MPSKKLYEGGPAAEAPKKYTGNPQHDYADLAQHPEKKAAYMKSWFTQHAPVDAPTKPKK